MSSKLLNTNDDDPSCAGVRLIAMFSSMSTFLISMLTCEHQARTSSAFDEHQNVVNIVMNIM